MKCTATSAGIISPRMCPATKSQPAQKPRGTPRLLGAVLIESKRISNRSNRTYAEIFTKKNDKKSQQN